MKFDLQHTAADCAARVGEITTDHGVIPTPIFMPVGTAASVKGVFHRDLKNEVKARIILANTYHLYLRPGTDILEQAGGGPSIQRVGWSGAHRQWRISGFFAGHFA